MKSRTHFETRRRENWDVNRRLSMAAGRRARDEGRLLSDCPHFEQYAGLRAAELATAWQEGWRERDGELRTQGRLPYKEDL